MKIRIFILGTVFFTIEGIKNFLESNYTSVSVISENWEKIFKDLQENCPDILLIDDYCMDKDQFLTLLNNLLKTRVSTRIILLSGSYDTAYFKLLVNLGIRSLIHKTGNKEEIFKAIEAINRGGIYFDEVITKLMILSPPVINNHFSDLSRREVEILKLIYQKKTNKEIASELFISVKTVENHKEKIKSKLALKSVREIYNLKLNP